MASGLKVKVLRRSFISAYIIQFMKVYNAILDGESSVEMPIVSLDLESLSKGNKLNSFKVILEFYELPQEDVFNTLNNRALSRVSCVEFIKDVPEISIEEFEVLQDRADNLDGFMWGVCISAADRGKKKERQKVKNSKSFINDVLGFIKGAGVVIC